MPCNLITEPGRTRSRMQQLTKESIHGAPCVWYGPWYPSGHNNCRYEALLPRLASVHPIYLHRSHRRWRMALRRRLDTYVLSRFWYPWQISQLAQKYRCLFCTDPSQIAHFPGPVIVDDDDPVFTPDHIAMLNRENVVAVVTTTELLKSRLVSAGLNKPCHVVPSGVYLSSLDMSKAKTLGHSLGKRPTDIVVGFAAPRLYTDEDRQARSAEGKLRSIGFLADVMERVWQEDPAIQLWLLGLPSRSVKAYASVHPQVHLLGYVRHLDVLNYFANFDIAVYPRQVDFGGRHSIKLIEYMAAGVPVIATPVAESFHVTQSGAGILAEDAEAFAEQILRLAGDARLRHSLGQAGQRYARQFDWDVLAQRYEREVMARYL